MAAFGFFDLTGLVFRLFQNRAEIERIWADIRSLGDKVAPGVLPGGAGPVVSQSAVAAAAGSPPDFSMLWLQQSLNKLNNAGLDVDGEYGENTRAAIMAFQSKNGLVADGWAGVETSAKIYSLLNA
jgi:lysozyme family protein